MEEAVPGINDFNNNEINKNNEINSATLYDNTSGVADADVHPMGSGGGVGGAVGGGIGGWGEASERRSIALAKDSLILMNEDDEEEDENVLDAVLEGPPLADIISADTVSIFDEKMKPLLAAIPRKFIGLEIVMSIFFFVLLLITYGNTVNPSQYYGNINVAILNRYNTPSTPSEYVFAFLHLLTYTFLHAFSHTPLHTPTLTRPLSLVLPHPPLSSRSTLILLLSPTCPHSDAPTTAGGAGLVGAAFSTVIKRFQAPYAFNIDYLDATQVRHPLPNT